VCFKFMLLYVYVQEEILTLKFHIFAFPQLIFHRPSLRYFDVIVDVELDTSITRNPDNR